MQTHMRALAVLFAISMVNALMSGCNSRDVAEEEVTENLPVVKANAAWFEGLSDVQRREVSGCLVRVERSRVRRLLESGREPQSLVEEYLVAVQQNDMDKVRELLAAGIGVNWLSYDDETRRLSALDIAARDGHVDLVRFLLQSGAQTPSGAAILVNAGLLMNSFAAVDADEELASNLNDILELLSAATENSRRLPPECQPGGGGR